MSSTMIGILIAGALFVHGIGHTLGLWMPSRSWLLPNVGESALKVVSSTIWILTTIGFLVTCLSFLGVAVPGDWWRTLAVAFALISLSGLVLFWGTWPVMNMIGALTMNIVVLITQLWLRWPPTNLFGA